LMVTNCSEERSYYGFKIIKNELKGSSAPGQVVNMLLDFIAAVQ